MTNNVKVLPGAPIPGTEPVPSVIEHLRERLAEAERGEIRAIATAVIKPNGAVSSGWQANGEFWKLIGAIDWLKHRMHQGDE